MGAPGESASYVVGNAGNAYVNSDRLLTSVSVAAPRRIFSRFESRDSMIQAFVCCRSHWAKLW